MLSNAVDASAPDSEINLESKADQQYIYFTVTDQGCGMTQEVAAQAHEPFFTTKAVGKGMGLGLFLAKSLASQLEGSLDIQSKEGQGTTVTMSFSKTFITKPAADREE
jgi:two-component system sensor histidine kinase RegB